jgi:microcompartment protein CcmK/EutM
VKLCRVIGTSVATVKAAVYDGRKVLVVLPVTPELSPGGATFLAVDFVQAGVGDHVLVAQEGNTARQLADDPLAPIHAAVLGIVDQIDMVTESGSR